MIKSRTVFARKLEIFLGTMVFLGNSDFFFENSLFRGNLFELKVFLKICYFLCDFFEGFQWKIYRN